ncbi:MAG: hypothetical protein ACRC8W_18790 [Plesiomonas shigelloides]
MDSFDLFSIGQDGGNWIQADIRVLKSSDLLSSMRGGDGVGYARQPYISMDVFISNVDSVRWDPHEIYFVRLKNKDCHQSGIHGRARVKLASGGVKLIFDEAYKD